MSEFSDKVISFSGEDRALLNKFYKAVLRAVQYSAFQNEGNGFQLLEGTVRKTKNGNYIFIPDANLRAMLEKQKVPALLKLEENRLVELIKKALEEL